MNKRQVNFAVEEERLLVRLVEQYKNIIESKKTGQVNWALKKNAWDEIAKKFNTQNSRNIQRNGDHLKEKYNNLKKKSKKKFSDEKRIARQTGGGPLERTDINDIDNAIYELIGPQIDGLISKYDDDEVQDENGFQGSNTMQTDEMSVDTSLINHDKPDASMHYNDDENVDMLEIPNATENNVVQEPQEENTNEAVNNTWNTYTSNDLKKPVSEKLRMRKNVTKKAVVNKCRREKIYTPLSHEVADAKLKFIKDQHMKFLAEHKLKMEVLEKKLKIQNKKCEILGIE